MLRRRRWLLGLAAVWRWLHVCTVRTPAAVDARVCEKNSLKSSKYGMRVSILEAEIQDLITDHHWRCIQSILNSRVLLWSVVQASNLQLFRTEVSLFLWTSRSRVEEREKKRNRARK